MFFLVNKPKNCTSFQVVNKFKNIFVDEKVGHAGTLDPMATGLLIIAVGRSDTKQLGKLLGLDKKYVAKIDFSIVTDTWDLDYHEKFEQFDITEENDNLGIVKGGAFQKAPTLKQIENKLNEIILEKELPLTMFSAKKIKGKKMYDLARKGEDLKLTKVMKTNSFKILNYEFPVLELELDVGSGTYIRTIAHWLGNEFNLGGTLTYLHRTSIGPFKTNPNPPKI